MVGRKGSYFFVIDAFIASIIILGAIVVLFSHFLTRPSNVQAFYTSEDLLSFMEGTQVRDFDSSLLRNWSVNGTINDTSRTLLQQLGYFNATSNLSEARQLAALVGQRVPENVNVELYLQGESYYTRSTVSKADAPIFFSGKRIVILRKGANTLYPPVVVEVQTWQ